MECEVPEFYEATTRKARKQYRCVECRAKIENGETYLNCVGKWNGEVSVNRQHILCAEACEWIRDKLNADECIPFGGLKEWVAECDLTVGSVVGSHNWEKLFNMMARIRERESVAVSMSES